MLTLYVNDIFVLDFKLLVGGLWPQLCSLMLDGRIVTVASWALFTLADSVPDSEKRSSCFVAIRAVSNTSVDCLLSRKCI